MNPALPARILAAVAFAAAVMVGGQFSSAGLTVQERQAGDRVRLVLYESPLQKWKSQCRRSGGKYEKYCAGGVKHCCCYSGSYCEGMPEPVDVLQQPAVRVPGDGSDTRTPGGQTISPQFEQQQPSQSGPAKVK